MEQRALNAIGNATTRKTFTRKNRLSIIDILYRCIDALSRNYDSVSINHNTGIVLPLLAVFYPNRSNSFQIPSKMKEMTVANVFQYNPDRRFLHWKDWQGPTLRHWKQALKKIFQGIQSGELQLHPFFLPLCLPSDSSGSPIVAPPPVLFSPFVQQLEVFQENYTGLKFLPRLLEKSVGWCGHLLKKW
ncbi:unnamed protein product [Mucor circinelloides]